MLDRTQTFADPDAAVSFLEALRPGGPWNLSAIRPDGGITSASFANPQKARAWIAGHADHANLYYGINPAKPGRSGRAKKADTTAIEYLFADLDADKFAEGHALFGLPLEERKDAVMRELSGAPNPPTFIVDSGGGLQALWRLDDPLPVTEENVAWAEGSNRWLAQNFTGGDKGVTDIGRLLRLPGSVNFPDERKRKRGRTVAATKLLASTGELHNREAFGQVEAAAGKLDAEHYDVSAIEYVTDLDALAAEYNLPERFLTIIRDGRLPEAKQGDDSRSAWLFDLTCGLARHGVPGEVIAGVLLNPEWAISASIFDHPGRPPEEQATREAGRALAAFKAERQSDMDQMAAHAVTPSVAGRAGNVAGLSFHKASNITIRPLNPLWPGRIYRGKLTTLAGMPEQGKSMVTCDICARVSRGAEWPDGSGRAPLGTAIMLASEDDPADTIVPRLMAAGADLNKVIIVESLVTGEKGGKRMLNIADDLEKLDGLVRQFPDTRVLIVDPVNSYMGTSKDNDSFRDSDVRAVLGPLKEWGERNEIAVAIVIHFKKGGSGRALDQVMGSIAFTALARSAWAFIEEKDGDGRATGRKLMARIKQNITAPVDALAYRLVGVDIADGINAPRAEWDGVVLGSADDVLMGGQTKGSGKSKAPTKTDAACVFLIGRLADGPVPAAKIQEAAKEAGYSKNMLNEAKERVGVESYKQGAAWFWRLHETEVPEC